jgi:VanZ family protein
VIRLALIFAAFIALLVVLADTHSLGPLYAVYEFPYGDKIGHVTLYGTLTLLANLALMQLRGGGSPRTVLLASAAMLVVVSLEELSQLLFPARTVDIFDLVASAAGVAWFGCLSLFIVEWRQSTIGAGRVSNSGADAG